MIVINATIQTSCSNVPWFPQVVGHGKKVNHTHGIIKKPAARVDVCESIFFGSDHRWGDVPPAECGENLWRSMGDSWLFSWEHWSPETPESHGFWHCFDHHDDGGVRVQFSNEWSDARLFKTFQYQDCHRHSVGMSRLILDGLQLNVRNNDGREVNHLLNPKFEITWCWGLKKEQWSERWWNFRW